MIQMIYILINKAEITNFSQSHKKFFEKLKKSVFFLNFFFNFGRNSNSTLLCFNYAITVAAKISFKNSHKNASFYKKTIFQQKKLVKISDQARFKSRPYYFGFQFPDANFPMNESFIIWKFQDSQIIVQLDKNIFPSNQKISSVTHFFVLIMKISLMKFLIVQEKMLLYPKKFKFCF